MSERSMTVSSAAPTTVEVQVGVKLKTWPLEKPTALKREFMARWIFEIVAPETAATFKRSIFPTAELSTVREINALLKVVWLASCPFETEIALPCFP
jgi:hypothetical protein